jgi:lactate dehydrogenase-like 2-hydroxyacid dehydrogenase
MSPEGQGDGSKGVQAGHRDTEAIVSEVIALIGAGSIGQAIARRVGAGRKVVVADLQQDNVERRPSC